MGSQPEVFVGNALPENDTVTVNINPLAAYENETDVRFEITIEAQGPMYDSEIQITVPEGLSNIQKETSADPDYVDLLSTGVSKPEIDVDF